MTLKFGGGDGGEMAMGIRHFNLRSSPFRKRGGGNGLNQSYIYTYKNTHTPFPHYHVNFFLFALFNSGKKPFLSIKNFGEAFDPTFTLKLRPCVSSWALLGTVCTVLGYANE